MGQPAQPEHVCPVSPLLRSFHQNYVRVEIPVLIIVLTWLTASNLPNGLLLVIAECLLSALFVL